MATSTSSLDTPVPLSFPAILRNPALNDRFAHLSLREETTALPRGLVVKKHRRSDDNLGKRWVRRKDNARFVGNPHIVAALKSDYAIPVPGVRTTFESPLQPYLQRTAKLPTRPSLRPQLSDINAGRFSMSIKGMRKDLRGRDTYRTRLVVQTVEQAIKSWLAESAVFLAPDRDNELELPGRELVAENGEAIGVREVARTPTKLIWDLGDDAFARFIVHCCARWYEVVSFSKGVSGFRLMHLLRPNVSRPHPTTKASIDTPPTTDLDGITSHIESDFSSFDSDLVSHLDSDIGDIDSEAEPMETHGLGAISESESVNSRESRAPVIRTDDVDADESGSEIESMSASLELASLNNPDETLQVVPERIVRSAVPLRSRMLRNPTSSLSPSPVRRTPKKASRRKARSLRSRGPGNAKSSFYDYIFK